MIHSLTLSAGHGTIGPVPAATAPDWLILLVYGLIGLLAVYIFVLLGLIWRGGRENAAVVADALYYLVISAFVLYTVVFATQITFEVIILVALLGGLSTFVSARIISKGRR